MVYNNDTEIEASMDAMPLDQKVDDFREINAILTQLEATLRLEQKVAQRTQAEWRYRSLSVAGNTLTIVLLISTGLSVVGTLAPEETWFRHNWIWLALGIVSSHLAIAILKIRSNFTAIKLIGKLAPAFGYDPVGAGGLALKENLSYQQVRITNTGTRISLLTKLIHDETATEEARERLKSQLNHWSQVLHEIDDWVEAMFKGGRLTKEHYDYLKHQINLAGQPII